MLRFRPLKADEIDCKVKQVTRDGVLILLYKDARVDQNILDETVGALNWQREHTRDNANCIVSIWDDVKKQWIRKEDTGTESYTEAEKGLASDSFKRACFNWGIGRELYTTPKIWISSAVCKIDEKYGKFSTREQFHVDEIAIDAGCITYIRIANRFGKNVFEWAKPNSPIKVEQEKTATEPEPKENPGAVVDTVKIAALVGMIKKKGVSTQSILKHYGVQAFSQLDFNQWRGAMEILEKYPDK